MQPLEAFEKLFEFRAWPTRHLPSLALWSCIVCYVIFYYTISALYIYIHHIVPYHIIILYSITLSYYAWAQVLKLLPIKAVSSG